jgi:hypothetical protein
MLDVTNFPADPKCARGCTPDPIANLWTTIAFLDAFFGDEPRTLVALKKKDGKTKVLAKTFRADDRGMARWVTDRNERDKYDLYFAPNPLKGPTSKKATKHDVREAAHLWADLDPKRGEDLESERTEMLRLLRDERPQNLPHPTWIIDSGRGYWGYWKLQEPQPVDGRGPLTATVERRGRGIEMAFGERYADGMRNIDRIARLPGTVNHKTGTRATVVEWNPKNVYRLAEFPEWQEPEHKPGGEPEADPARIAAALEFIPSPEGDWEPWNHIGMAVFRATGGSEAGFAAFDTWSKRSKTYDADATRARWEHYHTSPPTEIGAGTIFHEAKQHGWQPGLTADRALEEMNAEWAVVRDGGKTLVLGFNENAQTDRDGNVVHQRLVPEFLAFGEFHNFYKNRFVLVDDKPKALGNWWTVVSRPNIPPRHNSGGGWRPSEPVERLGGAACAGQLVPDAATH